MARRKARAQSRAARRPDPAAQAVVCVLCLLGTYLYLYHRTLPISWVRDFVVATTPHLRPPHSAKKRPLQPTGRLCRCN